MKTEIYRDGETGIVRQTETQTEPHREKTKERRAEKGERERVGEKVRETDTWRGTNNGS